MGEFNRFVFASMACHVTSLVLDMCGRDLADEGQNPPRSFSSGERSPVFVGFSFDNTIPICVMQVFHIHRFEKHEYRHLKADVG